MSKIKKLFAKIPFRFVRKADYEAAMGMVVEKLQLINRAANAEQKNKALEFQIEAMRAIKPVIDITLGDPTPGGGEKRRAYVGAVAGLHKDILRPKLERMIGAARALLDDQANPREYDLSVKGAIYALWEIIRWGDTMVNEQVSYLQEGSEENVIKKTKVY